MDGANSYACVVAKAGRCACAFALAAAIAGLFVNNRQCICVIPAERTIFAYRNAFFAVGALFAIEHGNTKEILFALIGRKRARRANVYALIAKRAITALEIQNGRSRMYDTLFKRRKLDAAGRADATTSIAMDARAQKPHFILPSSRP